MKKYFRTLILLIILLFLVFFLVEEPWKSPDSINPNGNPITLDTTNIVF